jgi:hypothetical protein
MDAELAAAHQKHFFAGFEGEKILGSDTVMVGFRLQASGMGFILHTVTGYGNGYSHGSYQSLKIFFIQSDN